MQVPLWGAVAPASAWRTSFHKEVVKHYLGLFVDVVGLVVDRCLHSIWELSAKASDIMAKANVWDQLEQKDVDL